MTVDNDLTRRVASALDGVARRHTIPAAAPVADVIAGAGHRHRRRVATATAVVLVVLIGTVIVGIGISTRDNSQPATDSGDILERAALNSHMLLPPTAPFGLAPSTIDASGPVERGTNPDSHDQILASADGSKALSISSIFLPGGQTEMIDSMLQGGGGGTEVSVAGHRAAYTVSRTGNITIVWPAQVNTQVLFGAFGITVAEALGFASKVQLSGSTATLPPQPGYEERYNGDEINAQQIEVRWAADLRHLSIAVEQTSPGAPVQLVFGAGQPMKIRATTAMAFGRDKSWMLVWEESSGVRERVTGEGFTLEELRSLAESLVSIDRVGWRSLVAAVPQGGVFDQIQAPDRDQSDLAQAGTPATTAVAATPAGQPGADVDLGSVAAVPLGGHVEPSRELVPQFSASAVVHSLDDHWYGVMLEASRIGINSLCRATARKEDNGNVIGWTDSCSGANYGINGACLDKRCFVGLDHFDVRVVDGRIMASTKLIPGAPRPDMLG